MTYKITTVYIALVYYFYDLHGPADQMSQSRQNLLITDSLLNEVLLEIKITIASFYILHMITTVPLHKAEPHLTGNGNITAIQNVLNSLCRKIIYYLKMTLKSYLEQKDEFNVRTMM